LHEAQVGARQVWFSGGDTGLAGGFIDTPVYKREWFPQGIRFAGPAIIEQLDCTTVVDPGAEVALDAIGNLIVTL
jgi:N-methylhydantoinase A